MAANSENLDLDGRDPAVLWYFENWSGGTSRFTRHLKGCFMDLLNAEFHGGPLSLDEVKTILGSDFGSSWPTLQKKFKVSESGLYYNSRLEKEILKRKAFVDSRRNNLKGTKHKDDHKPPHKGIGIGLGIGNGFQEGGAGGRIPADAARDQMHISWETWGNQIVDDLDPGWHAMRGRKVTRQEMDAFISVATRKAWVMDSQQKFRVSLRGFDSKNGGQDGSKPKAFDL